LRVNRFFVVISLLFVITGNISIAQVLERKPLNDLLLSLEQKFNVVFTYADENIKGIEVKIHTDYLTLDEYIKELERQTRLEFERLNFRYIAIYRKTSDIAISGIIIDKSTQEPLTGANIYTSKRYSISDDQGKFSIKINRQEDSLLNISYLGFSPAVFSINSLSSDSIICELARDIHNFEEVVFNYIAKGINKLADGSIQLNIKNMEILPGLSEPDVLHTVQVLPGISSLNETVSDINNRGGTNDQNLILWEGIKMYQTGHFFGLISAFNSHLVHKTKIIKNGASASYAEGVSGIIDMKQQEYQVAGFEVNSGINMISADAIIKVPISQKFSMVLGARHSINSIMITPTYKSYYNRAFEYTDVLQHQSNDTIVDDFYDFSFYDLSFKLLYDISNKDKVWLSFLSVDNQIEYDENALIRDTLYSDKSSLNQSSILTGINYSHTWNKNNSVHVNAFVSSYSLDGVNASLINDQQHIQKNEVLDWGIKLESRNTLNELISLSSGYQFNEIGVRNQDNISKPNYKRDVRDVLLIHSFYSEAELNKLFDKIYFRFGLRANYYQKFNEFILEPRLALNYNLTKNISFEVLAESKSQHTTQLIDYQTDFHGIEKRRWVLSNNTSIPIIKSKQFSIGVQYMRNNYLFSLEAYTKNVDGIITPSQGFLNQYQYVYAIGKYETQGLELLLDKRFIKSNIWVNYTISQNDYYFKDFTPSSFPNNIDVRHSLSLGASYIIKNIEVSSGLNYRTGKPYTQPSNKNIDNEIIYEEPNSSRLDDYIRLDVSAKYSFNLKKVKGELGVSIWNILNRENDINIFYQLNQNNEIEKFTQHALEITPNVNLRFYF
jgi:hypothetical protein